MTERRPKGSGTIETTAEGLFRARYAFDVGGPREEVGVFRTYAEASDRLDGILAELREAGGVRGRSLRKLGERCLDMREKEGFRNIKDERGCWRRYVEPWDRIDVPGTEITRGDVRDWLAELAGKGLAVQTRRNALNVLRAVLAAGVEDGHLVENVAFGVKVKSRGTTKETSTHLSRAEVDRLMEKSNDPAVALAIWTGMRQGELRSLLWDDVHEAHIVVRYGKPDEPTKNGKIREVPILAEARAVLDALPRTHAMVLPTPRGCFRPKGRIVAPLDWSAWKKAAGIKRRVRWHDLRHTCATLLLTGDLTGDAWSLEAVKEMLGHSSIKVTERYAKATGSLAAKAARAAHKPGISPGADPALAAQAREIVGRRGSDSNRRMTVLQSGANANETNYLDRLLGLARAYLAALAAGSVFSHRAGRELADAVLELEETGEVTLPAAAGRAS